MKLRVKIFVGRKNMYSTVLMLHNMCFYFIFMSNFHHVFMFAIHLLDGWPELRNGVERVRVVVCFWPFGAVSVCSIAFHN